MNISSLFFPLLLFVTSCSKQEVQSARVSEDSKSVVEVKKKTKMRLSLWGSKKSQAILVGKDGLIEPKLPDGIIPVKAKVTKVNLPFLDSPSIAGERAVATFSINDNHLDFLTNISEIDLRYDSYVNPFSVGDEFTLQFLVDGSFWGIKEIPVH